MNPDIFMLFEKAPGTLPLYEALEKRIVERYPDVGIKVKATQVSFYNTHAFAWAWPPFRKREGWPQVYMLVTFGLSYEIGRLAEMKIRRAKCSARRVCVSPFAVATVPPAIFCTRTWGTRHFRQERCRTAGSGLFPSSGRRRIPAQRR